MEKACFFRIMRCLPFMLSGLAGLFFVIVWVAPLSLIFVEDAASSEPAAETNQPPADFLNRVENSVVKIFATTRYPDLFKPWTKQAPQEVTGSGVIIEGKRILTNAHVILYASQVQVQANQSSNKISATVEAIAPGIDLAVLKLEDETFFNTRPPLERANHLPEIEDAVMAYGFPIGGTSLSITKGIVSRIEFMSYSYSVSGLRIQIDAAINPGNSGGPAVADGKMIGLAFSNLMGTQNIGYIIPCEEIELFLQDIADGEYDGKPAIFDELQTLENPALRSFLKLGKAVEGIVVHQPFRTDMAYPLKEWDVITKIGDRRIDNEGMIKVNTNLRVRFQYLIQKIAKNGKVPLTVVRAGKTLAVEVPVASTRPMLIPLLEGTYPSYFVYGPLVFSNATIEFISGLRENPLGMHAFPSSPLVARMFDAPAFDGEELVVVTSPFFPHKLAKDYSNPVAEVVKTVNDIPIKNLRHLVEVLRDSRAEFIKFEFSLRGGETLVFPRKEMLAATEEILADNDIRAQGSPETLTIWNAKLSR
jgi:S1-C subfamily serine protease